MGKGPFTFIPPEYGWIRLRISGEEQTSVVLCTCVSDPFPSFFEWLEQIASGAEHAIWHIEEEGQSSRLMFMAGSSFVGDHQSYLIHCRSYGNVVELLTDIPIEREKLVQSLYCAFRGMVEHARYDPRHWEIHPEWHKVDLDDEDALDAAMEDWPFSGEPLSLMRSAAIETYLAELFHPSAQLELAFDTP